MEMINYDRPSGHSLRGPPGPPGRKPPSACWPLCQQESRLEDALLAALTPEQTELLETYQAAAWRHTKQEERFLFRSGFRLARELSLLPGGLLRL